MREQVSLQTYEPKKAFYEAWEETTCCADDCDQFCDQCSNKGIKFQSTAAFELNPDVRRYIARYGCYQTISELREEEDAGREESTDTVFPGVRDGKSDNDTFQIRGHKEMDYLDNQKKFPAIKLKGSKRCYHTPSLKKWLLEHQINNAVEKGV